MKKFAPLLGRVLEYNLKIQTIVNAFKKTSLIHLDSTKVTYDGLVRKPSTNGHISFLSESKEIKGHLHYLESKMSVEKIRLFVQGQAQKQDESLLDIWTQIR